MKARFWKIVAVIVTIELAIAVYYFLKFVSWMLKNS